MQHKLEILLSGKDIDFEILNHEKPIKSRNDALNYFNLEEMAPTLVLETEIGMYALIISGDYGKVDLEQIRMKLNCTKIRMARCKDLINKLGIQPGEVPLVGHGLPSILHNKLFRFPYVFGGTGDACRTLKINPHDLEKMNEVIFCID